MSLISILICLAAESYWEKVDHFRQYDRFDDYYTWVLDKLEGQSFRDTAVGVLLTIMPLVLLVLLLESLLGGLASLLGFLFGLVVLLYTLGPRSLVRDVNAYLEAAEVGDHDTAKQQAGLILQRQVTEKPDELAQRVKEAILVQTNDRLVAVMFWFALLGPVGAVLFRLTSMLHERVAGESSGYARAAHDLFWIMNWIPARLCILGYALAGNFIDTVSHWRGMSDFWACESEALLLKSGLGSLRQDLREDDDIAPQGDVILSVHHAMALMKRTIIVLLTVLALMTLAGWLL